jgi:2-methylisocitrate lyase-like PEP mutase family enzyme
MSSTAGQQPASAARLLLPQRIHFTYPIISVFLISLPFSDVRVANSESDFHPHHTFVIPTAISEHALSHFTLAHYRPTFRYHSFVMTPHSQTPAMSLAQKAARLLELHHGSQPLVLINAWDAASAAMVEHCGLPAIATSSAAMANALGFPDGQYIPWPQMLEAVARVCRAVKVPVTADIESGFAPDVTALETSITQIIQAGAVGVNLEDLMPSQSENVRHGNPLFPLPEQIARIQAARRAARAAEIHLVINARTDAYWQAGVEPAEAMRNTLERGQAYLQAGADCIFIPGLRNPDHIRTVIDYLRANPPSVDPLPAHHGEPAINILAGPGVPSIPELARLGVKRVSYGSGPHRAAMGLLRRIASEASTSGTFNALTEGAVPYEEINGLMGK